MSQIMIVLLVTLSTTAALFGQLARMLQSQLGTIKFICPMAENTMQRRAEKERIKMMDLRMTPSFEVDLTLRKTKAKKTARVAIKIMMYVSFAMLLMSCGIFSSRYVESKNPSPKVSPPFSQYISSLRQFSEAPINLVSSLSVFARSIALIMLLMTALCSFFLKTPSYLMDQFLKWMDSCHFCSSEQLSFMQSKSSLRLVISVWKSFKLLKRASSLLLLFLEKLLGKLMTPQSKPVNPFSVRAPISNPNQAEHNTCEAIKGKIQKHPQHQEHQPLREMMRGLPFQFELDEELGVLVESADIDGQDDEAGKVDYNEKKELRFEGDEGKRRFA